MRFISFLILLFCLPISAAENNVVDKATHINFEQALFLHLQERYLDAISLSELLSTKNKQNSIQQKVLLSQSYFNYQLPRDSLSILNNSLKTKLSKADQDILLFHIGKNQYDNQQIKLALNTFLKIKAPINPLISSQLNYLLGDIYIRTNTLNKAEKIAGILKGNNTYFPYIAHNLAIALLNNKQRTKALIWVNELNNDQYAQHKKLKNSLLLSVGISYLRDKQHPQAIELFLQIKKGSDQSSKGLLALGQSLILDKQIKEGHRFYNYLSNYPKQNLHYQESLLYLAESSKGNTAKSLLKHAISNYDDLLDELKTISNPITDSALSSCLLNKTDDIFCTNTHLWLKKFKQTLSYNNTVRQQNQLLNIQNTLFDWSEKLPIYDFILTQRTDDFNNKLPNLKSKFSPNQLSDLTDRFTQLKKQINKQSISPFAFINEDESDQIEDINYVEATVKRINKEAIDDIKDRVQFAKGILMWDLAQQKPARLRQASKHINDVEKLLAFTAKGIKKLQQFNDLGDLRLTRLSDTLKQAEITLERLAANVERLLNTNQQHLTALAGEYLLKRRATLIQLNSRSKYLLTQLQDVQR